MSDENKELAQLQRKLAEATKLIKRPQSDPDLEPDAPNHARQAASMALSAVRDYLLPLVEIGHLIPLRELSGALEDADEGRSNPLLEIKHITGAPRMPIDRAMRLALASAAVDFAMKAGHSKPEALSLILRHLPRDNLDAKKLGGFRDRLRRGKVSDAARHIYAFCLRNVSDLPPDEAADRLLTHLDPPDE